MNRTQRMNRPKRLRLALEASGSAAATANHTPAILALAKDKTPIALRVGKYYAKVKQGARKQYLNVVPKHKRFKQPEVAGLFAKMLASIKNRFGFKKYAAN